jgi:hypothetical protein
MNRIIIVAGMSIALGFFVFGAISQPSQSVLMGNVYDIYSYPPSGSPSILVVHCGSFAQAQSLQAANPSLNYATVYNSACGPAVTMTSTTLGGTTFTNGPTSTTTTLAYCGTVPYNPQQQSCSSQTTIATTISVTATATTVSTTTALTTTVITVTSTGSPTTLTVTASCTTSCNNSNSGILYGELLGVIIAIVGIVIKGKK